MAINTDNPLLEETSQDLVIVKDKSLQAGFTQVPNAILKMPNISHGAKLAYAVLLSYAWQKDSCFAGQEQLAKDLCVDRRTIIRFLNELKGKKLIQVLRRGMGKTNIYYLESLSEADVTNLSHQEVTKNVHQEVTKMTHKEHTLKNTQKEEYKISRDSRSTALKNPGKREEGSEATPNLGNLSPGQSFTPITALLTEKQARISQRKNNRFSKTPVPPEVTAAIREVSGKLTDTTHIRENISQAANLYRAWGGVNGSSFTSYVYEACAITRQQAQVKKQMPYFFQVLKGLLGLSEVEEGSIAPG